MERCFGSVERIFTVNLRVFIYQEKLSLKSEGEQRLLTVSEKLKNVTTRDGMEKKLKQIIQMKVKGFKNTETKHNCKKKTLIHINIRTDS